MTHRGGVFTILLAEVLLPYPLALLCQCLLTVATRLFAQACSVLQLLWYIGLPELLVIVRHEFALLDLRFYWSGLLFTLLLLIGGLLRAGLTHEHSSKVSEQIANCGVASGKGTKRTKMTEEQSTQQATQEDGNRSMQMRVFEEGQTTAKG